jgi:hypothetical protein
MWVGGFFCALAASGRLIIKCALLLLLLLLLQGPQAMGQAAAGAEPHCMPLPLGSMAGEPKALHAGNTTCCVCMYCCILAT